MIFDRGAAVAPQASIEARFAVRPEPRGRVPAPRQVAWERVGALQHLAQRNLPGKQPDLHGKQRDLRGLLDPLLDPAAREPDVHEGAVSEGESETTESDCVQT